MRKNGERFQKGSVRPKNGGIGRDKQVPRQVSNHRPFFGSGDLQGVPRDGFWKYAGDIRASSQNLFPIRKVGKGTGGEIGM